MLLKECKIYWAKVLGKPRISQFAPEGQWSFDVALTPEAKKLLKEHGAGSRIKNNEDERGDFITLRKRGVLKSGDPAKSIQVIDHKGEQWDPSVLIGNGSVVNVSVLFDEYGEGKAKKVQVKPMAVQVWELVKYKRSDFPTREDSERLSEELATETW